MKTSGFYPKLDRVVVLDHVIKDVIRHHVSGPRGDAKLGTPLTLARSQSHCIATHAQVKTVGNFIAYKTISFFFESPIGDRLRLANGTHILVGDQESTGG